MNSSVSTARVQGKSSTFFISYNHLDKGWAEWIAWVIEERGHKARIQAWDFLPGNSFVQEMQESLNDFKAVICVLTNNFLNSKFTAAEWQTAFAKDPIGEKRLLIPIRVEDCKPDSLLSTRIYIDLVGKTRVEARDLIVSGIFSKRNKPVNEPNFPGETNKEPCFPGVKIEISYILVLDGIFSQYDKAKIEAVLAHLQNLLEDSNLTISSVQRGSAIITIRGNEDSFKVLEEIYKNNPDLSYILNEKILGLWAINNNKKGDLVSNRLEEYRPFITSYFKEYVSPKNLKDLFQDFIVEVLSLNEGKYAVLSNPFKAIQIADRLLFGHLTREDEDALIRQEYAKHNPDSIDRNEVLRLSMRLFKQLNSNEQEFIENYWNARFEGNDLVDDIEDYASALSAEKSLRNKLKNRLSEE
ncbi:MAG: toll/interleukin-1 receptor domain-containing protein [Janthinobacterium lividum]